MEEKFNLKDIVKGSADIDGVRSGGIVIYHITTEDGSLYQLDIDLSDTHDVGETATFMAHYDKALTLMRWIRRAVDNGSLIKLK